MNREEEVRDALARVLEPETQRDLISAQRVKNLEVSGDRVSFTVLLTPRAWAFRGQVEKEARIALGALGGVREVAVTFQETAASPGAGGVAGVNRIVAVGSGKGGVGKSTVAVNLAAALAADGVRTGLLDADIYGPSIPLMMGVHEQPRVENERMIPPENHGVKLMSLGFLLPDHTAPVVWRGPMVAMAVQQMLNDVSWGELDFLLVDLPPGTGDATLTLAQAIPLSGAVIVMTPQEVAVQIATKTLNMFRTLRVPILGIIENMSHLACPHCGKDVPLFGAGGARRASQLLEAPFLGEIPLDSALCEGSDAGVPIVLRQPESAAARVFRTVAGGLRERVGGGKPAAPPGGAAR